MSDGVAVKRGPGRPRKHPKVELPADQILGLTQAEIDAKVVREADRLRSQQRRLQTKLNKQAEKARLKARPSADELSRAALKEGERTKLDDRDLQVYWLTD